MSDDAELVSAGAAFQELEEAITWALDEDVPSDDRLLDLHERLAEVCETATLMTARSQAGICAKAAILLRLLEATVGDGNAGAEMHEKLAASLANDVLRHCSAI